MKMTCSGCCPLPASNPATIPLKINGQSEKDELKRAFANACLNKIQANEKVTFELKFDSGLKNDPDFEMCKYLIDLFNQSTKQLQNMAHLDVCADLTCVSCEPSDVEAKAHIGLFKEELPIAKDPAVRAILKTHVRLANDTLRLQLTIALKQMLRPNKNEINENNFNVIIDAIKAFLIGCIILKTSSKPFLTGSLPTAGALILGDRGGYISNKQVVVVLAVIAIWEVYQQAQDKGSCHAHKHNHSYFDHKKVSSFFRGVETSIALFGAYKSYTKLPEE